MIISSIILIPGESKCRKASGNNECNVDNLRASRRSNRCLLFGLWCVRQVVVHNVHLPSVRRCLPHHSSSRLRRGLSFCLSPPTHFGSVGWGRLSWRFQQLRHSSRQRRAVQSRRSKPQVRRCGGLCATRTTVHTGWSGVRGSANPQVGAPGRHRGAPGRAGADRDARSPGTRLPAWKTPPRRQ